MVSTTLAETARALVASVPRWHHKFEIFSGVITPGAYDPTSMWERLQIDAACTGRTLLDIGASDGFFSRQAFMMGADVTAMDYRPKDGHGFAVMERLLGHVFPYEHCNLMDLDTVRLGSFDIVLFLGVLYHLPDMMRALHLIRSVCRKTLFVETHADNDFCPDVSAARYWRGDSFNGDLTNFWSPNTACTLDMLHDAGYDVVRHEACNDRLFIQAEITRDTPRLRKMHSAYGHL